MHFFANFFIEIDFIFIGIYFSYESLVFGDKIIKYLSDVVVILNRCFWGIAHQYAFFKSPEFFFGLPGVCNMADDDVMIIPPPSDFD